MSLAIKNLTKEELINKYFEQEELINKLNKNIDSLSDELSVSINLFENSPIPMWEEEITDLIEYLNKIKGDGNTDLKKYFETNPDEVQKCIGKVRVIDVNKAAVKLHKAETKQELLNNIEKVFTDDAKKYFIDKLVAISEGETNYIGFTEAYTFTNELIDLKIFLQITEVEHNNRVKFTAIVSTIELTHLAQSTSKLKESQKLISSLVENANEGIIIAQGWQIKFSNKHFYNMLGYTRDEILNVPIENLLSNSKNANLIRNRFEERIKGESVPNIYEAEVISKHGKIIPIEINAHTIEYEGQPAVQSVVRDISDRKANEAERDLHQKELNLIYNATSDIMALIKVEGKDLKLISFNNSFWKSVQDTNSELTKSDLLNSSLFTIKGLFSWPKRFMDNMISNFEKNLNSPETFESFESIPIGPLNKYFRIKHTPILDNKGSCTHILLVVQDLSEQRNFESKITLYANILDSSPIAFIVTNLEGKIIDVNPALEQLMGYNKEELLGLNPEILNAEDNANEIQNEIFSTLAKSNMWVGEIINKKKNDELFYNKCSIFPLRNKNNEVTAYVSFNQDITEQKNIAKTLSESEQILKETQNIASLGTYNYNITNGKWTSSEIMNRIFGIDESFNRSVEGWISLIHPEWQEKMHNYVVNYVLGGKNKFDKEYKILRYSDKAERWVHGIGEVKYDENGVPLFLLGTIRDITERINKDKLIREQDEYVKSIFSSAPVGIGVVINRVFNKVNLKLCNMTGYKQEELIGKSSEILYPTLKEYNWVGQQKYSQIEHTGSGTVETKFKTKEGNIINVLLSSTPIDQNDLLKGVTFTALDITDRKEAESALLKSRQRFESLFTNSPVPLWEETFTELYEYIEDLKKQGVKDFRVYFEKNNNEVIKCSKLVKIESVNKATLALYKAKNKEELLGNLEKIFTENSLLVFREEIITIAEGGSSFECESEVKTLTGENIIVFLKLTIQDNNRALLATLDITEKKASEFKIKESEDRYRNFIELSTEGVWRTELKQPCSINLTIDEQIEKIEQNSIEECNDVLAKMYGFKSVEDLIGNSIFDFLPDENKYFVIKSMIKNGYRLSDFESTEFNQIGEIVNFSNNVFCVIENDQLVRIWGTQSDITNRKLAEKKLIESEDKFSKIFKITPYVLIISRISDGKLLDFNDHTKNIIGLPREKMLNRTSIELGLITLEQRNILIDKIKSEGFFNNIELTVTLPNGEKRIGLFHGQKIKLGNEECIFQTILDITDRIRAEQQVRESEEKFHKIFRNSPDAIVLTKLSDGEIVEVNDATLQITEIKLEDLIGKKTTEVLIWENLADRERYVEKLSKSFRVRDFDTNLIIGEGEIRNCLISGELIKINNIDYILGIIRDVTEKKKADKALVESEEKYRMLVENQTDLVVEISKLNQFTFVSKSYCELFGRNEEDLIGNSFFSLIHEDDRALTEREMKKLFFSPYTCRLEQRAMTPKGWRWLEWNDTAKLDESNNVKSIMGVGRDITEKKEAEIALKASEEKFYKIFKNSPDAIILSRMQDGEIIDVNDSTTEIIGYQRSEIIGKRTTQIKLWHSKKDRANYINLLKKYGIAKSLTVEFLKKDGEKRIGMLSGVLLDLNNEKYIFGILRDITEKTNFEKKLQETNERLRNLTRYTNKVREEERKNFAREVHDNLGQKLTALNLDISWIKQNIPDELVEISKQFDPVLDLINQSIITVQKISTELRPGILDDLGLVNAIQWQSNEISRRTELKFSLNLYKHEIELDDNVKTALFRVFQEALTNIVRHANAGNVLVNLLIKEKKLIFEVIDDGKGISESEINEFTSLGIIGIKERIASIDGEIIFSRLTKGTMIQIIVPIKV